MDLVRGFRKDPSPAVRKIAKHIEDEAGEIEAKERWVDHVADNGLPHGDRDHVRAWLEKRSQRQGY